MLFPLRAALVIGALFYFSPLRPPLPWSAAPSGADFGRAARDAAAALPREIGERALRDGGDALLRHLASRDASGAPALPDAPPRDTLREADRAAAWHGVPRPPLRGD